jgi:hypothetical protein
MRSEANFTGVGPEDRTGTPAVPSFYFFQSTIANHKSSIPMRPQLQGRPPDQYKLHILPTIIDHEIIFDICKNHIPKLKTIISKIIESAED